MDNFYKMLNTQSILFIYLIVGIICRKTGIFSNELRSKLSDFVIHITLPCMIFESFHMEFSMSVLRESGIALLIASGMAAVSVLLGQILYRKMSPRRRSVMQYGTLCSNSVFTGFPIISGLYGASGLLLASFYVIPNRIMMWTAGVSYFTGKSGSKKQQILRVLRLPAVVAVYVGLLRMVLNVPLPAFVDTALNGVGNCTSPLAMALVGAILADTDVRSVFEPCTFYLVLIRQVVLPLICLGVLYFLPVDPLTVGVSVVISGMPVASTTAILAQKYDADALFASRCVFVSTLTSLITAPLLTLLLR